MRATYFKERLNRLEQRASELTAPTLDYSSLILGDFPDLRRWLQNESEVIPCPHRWFEFRRRSLDVAHREPNPDIKNALYSCISDAITAYAIRKVGDSYPPDQDPSWRYLVDLGWELPALREVISPDCTSLNCAMAGDSSELYRRQLWDTRCDNLFNSLGKHSAQFMAELGRRQRAIESEDKAGGLLVHHTSLSYE